MKLLIIGLGSIGKKHLKIAQELKLEVSVVSKSQRNESVIAKNLKDITDINLFDIIWICNETSRHQVTLEEIADQKFQGVVVVEKPLFEKYHTNINHNFKKLLVSYNLRFSSIIQKLKSELFDKQIFTAFFEVGSYLPSWRTDSDYSKSYSAKLELGGGVLNDLSHEVDLAYYLLGDFEVVAALGGKFSNLKIESDDAFNIISQNKKCKSVTISMNYLNRVPRRNIVINTNSGTYVCDLLKGSLYLNKEELMINQNIQNSYRNQILALAEKKYDEFSSEIEGIKIIDYISKIRQSSEKREFVFL